MKNEKFSDDKKIATGLSLRKQGEHRVFHLVSIRVSSWLIFTVLDVSSECSLSVSRI